MIGSFAETGRGNLGWRSSRDFAPHWSTRRTLRRFLSATRPCVRRKPVPAMTDDAERIIDLCERYADTWDRERWRNLFERPWLDRFLALIPAGGSIVIGCGSGEPIARYAQLQ